MEKNLEYYLTEARKKITSIEDEDKIKNRKGPKEDWLEEEAETDFSDEINEEQDAREDKIEKVEDILEKFAARNSEMSKSEAVKKIFKLFEK